MKTTWINPYELAHWRASPPARNGRVLEQNGLVEPARYWVQAKQLDTGTIYFEGLYFYSLVNLRKS